MSSSLPGLPRQASKLLKPGYAQLLGMIQNLVGVDPLTLVNAGLVLAGILTILRYFFTRVLILWVTVRINEDDALYHSLMRWMSDHQFMSRQFRSVKAISNGKSTWEDEEEALKTTLENGTTKILAQPDPNNLISYRSIVGRSPISLQPFQGTHLFRRHGSWILFQHQIRRGSELLPQDKETGYLRLTCLGSSFVPIRRLLEETQLYQIERTKTTTTVHRAISNVRDMIRWTRFSARPSRDMSTVIFDKDAKQKLLQDINEYLHPHTRRWYANHGIPYRRGYLFSGAPGTGKTSLTSALAGVFGLDIYVLSLLDPNMNESALMRLMSEVPSRCIVLLEDIDAAGLNRPASEPKQVRSGRRPPFSQGQAASDLLDAVQPNSQGVPNGSSATSVSLSGLLNAIDGVSSQEGRILIMTTNSPESLDKALIRPGRVDMHIAFELPSKTDMKELFLSMYRDDTAAAAHVSDEKEKADQNSLEPIAGQSLETLAERFAESVPEKTLSLAALQGYLLQYKSSPVVACEKATQWAEDSVKKMADENDQ